MYSCEIEDEEVVFAILQTRMYCSAQLVDDADHAHGDCGHIGQA